MINETLNEADEQDGQGRRGDPRGLRGDPHRPGATRRCSTSSPPTTTAAPTPLQQLASFTAPEARVIIISPYDHGAMAAIERAIRDSDLGVNPTDDGKTIRVVLPELTEERRKDYIKMAKTKAEDGRVVGAQHPPQRQAGPGQAREGRRGRQGRRHRRREAARRRSPRSTPTRSTSCSSTRKPSCSRSEPARSTTAASTVDPDASPGPPEPPPPKTSRAGPRPARRHRLGRGARRGAIIVVAGLLEAAVHGDRGRRGAGRDLGARPGLRRQAASTCPRSR